MSNESPDVVEMNEVGGMHHLEPQGVTSSLNMLGFHVFSGKPDRKHLFSGTALGRRNLEFRRAEATSGGYQFEECPGKDCPHHG